MDSETKQIVSEQSKLQELLSHEGWKIARRKIEEEILGLQNAFDIETGTPEEMIRDLQARKMASTMLFDWLRQLEGDAESAVLNKPQSKLTHVVDLDNAPQ